MKTTFKSVFLSTSIVILSACNGTGSGTTNASDNSSTPGTGSAQVTGVSISGEPGSYSFSVTIQSPDTGCDQYADWWEVVTADGRLVYRRILAHSHVSEQPFTRTGGPVSVLANEDIIVRAHMNNTGIGSQVFVGSVEQGLEQQTTDTAFAEELAFVDPLPANCAF